MMGDVFNLMKKSLYFSVGMMAFTVEKTGEIIDDFVKRGDQALEKHQATIDKLGKIEAEMEEKIKMHVEETLEHMNIPTRKDIEALNKKLDAIAKKL